ncbi:MAG: UDP-3-O-(3-hydroxymyristoyl)glucosamine N-acyltransferase [Gemmatimonadales bacterium]
MTDPMTAQAVADLVGGRLSGPGEVLLHRVRSLDRATGDALAMCTGRRYAAAMATSRAGAVLVPDSLATATGPVTRIIVADPPHAMLLATRALHPEVPAVPAIAPTAQIGRGVTLGVDVTIGPHSVIGDGARLGDRARIGAHVVIGQDVTVGADARLDPHVVIYDGATLGARVWCKAGAVIGGPGFGFASSASGHQRIPQVGGCIIEDDVEIGSHTCIDRGSLDDTRIGRGTKIDNQVHIAHNVHTGVDCLIMACVGVAGSTVLGDRVVLAGQSGCIDHVALGDDVTVGAKAAVMSNVPAGTAVSGYPARPHREFLRAMATVYRLATHGDTLESLAEEREDA